MDSQTQYQPGGEKPQYSYSEDKGREVHHHHYYGREIKHGAMNFGQLFFGLLLLFFGIAFLAKSMGLVVINMSISWGAVISVLVIIAGLSLISFRGWLGGLVGVILVFILAGIVLFMAFTPVNFSQFGMYRMMGWQGIDQPDGEWRLVLPGDNQGGGSK